MTIRVHTMATLALAAAVVGAGTLMGGAPALAKDKETMTRAVGLPLQAAQKDFQKGDYQAGLASIDKANAEAKKTPYEQHIINQMYVFGYQRMKQWTKVAPKLEALVGDGFTTPQQVQQYTVALAQINYQIHNYPDAIKYGEQAIAKGWGNAQMSTLVGQAYYLGGNWRGTVDFEKRMIAADEQKGVAPANEPLQLLLSSCLKLKDEACETDALEKLIVYHPKTQYWQQMLYTMFNSVKSDPNLLQTYRLASDVGVLKQPHEITDFAELAIEAGSPGEAEQVMQQALQNNIYTDAQAKAKAERILRDAQTQAKRDQASLPRQAREAAAASNGNQDYGLGLAYYGYRQYDKAVAALKEGIAKGGLKSPAEAQLLLGISQLKAGDKAAALKTFKKVKGNPVLEHLATLWSLRARQTTA